MTYKEAAQEVREWKANEPNKFQAWTWFGRGVKDAERYQINAGGDLKVVPFETAVKEFIEYWNYDRQAALAELTALDEELGLYD